VKHRIEHAVTHQSVTLKPGRPEPILPMVVLASFVTVVVVTAFVFIGQL
jgi:hypothetical protein